MTNRTLQRAPDPVPRATYRLQFHRGFNLRRAIELLPYLEELGISHLYASPLLQACPGSTHGYDVCDPSRINAELGTEQDLEELVAGLRRHGMGLVLDLVPNHMGICGRNNPWWWDVLKHGRTSRFADYFDIDWESPDPRLRGRILVPLLGDNYGRVLERRELQLVHEEGETLLAYFEHRLPLAPDTPAPDAGFAPENIGKLNGDPSALDEVIARQHYRLSDWHRGDADLNYRRFFNIWTLAGLRVEDPRVFDAAHERILRWHANGWIDGLRVDHPDGLRDPAAYFQRLRAAAPRAWIVAEKILQPDESIPDDWPVAGTTGYDFMRRVTGLFVDPAGEQPLSELYSGFTGEPGDYGRIVHEKQLLALRNLLAAEVSWLTRLLARITVDHWRYRDVAEEDLHEALIEVAARLPVYRTYVRPDLDHVSPADSALISQTIARARQARTDLPPEPFDLLEELLRLRLRGAREQDFVMRFQQLTGPAMAKGVEDTTCYCYNRLIALNMVGGDPDRFGVSPDSFHDQCALAQRRWPEAMLTTSTHDTKRSEDARMRMCLLSEIPDEWHAAVTRWSIINEKYRRGGWPDRNLEYFYYQTLVSAWPLPLERALPVIEKGSREAKQHTSWTRRNQEYDAALRQFVTGTLGDPEFTADLERFVTPLIEPGHVNSLAETLLKLTAPGVPDIYQGNELWDLSLVDPDNRRPVDFARRERLLAELTNLSAAQVWQQHADGLPKLWAIHKTLRFRRQHAGLFGAESSYEPLFARGARAAHLVAFIRGGGFVALAPRLVLRLANDWGDTTLRLPAGQWFNVFTGEDAGTGEVALSRLLGAFPVALLLRKEKTDA